MKSEAILNYAYHDGLELVFTGGRIYRYDVPISVYNSFHCAASKGRHYNRFIRGQYPCSEVHLQKAVERERRACALVTKTSFVPPSVEVLGDVIIVDGLPYGDGAYATAMYFLNRARMWLEQAIERSKGK